MGDVTQEMIDRTRRAKQRQLALAEERTRFRARERDRFRARERASAPGLLAQPRPTSVPFPLDPSMYGVDELGLGPRALPQATSKPPPMLSVEEFLKGDPTQEQITQREIEQDRRRAEPIRRFVRGMFDETPRRLAGAGTYLAQTLGLPGEDIRQRVEAKRARGMSIGDATQEVWLEGTGWPSVDIGPALTSVFPYDLGEDIEIPLGWQGLAEGFATPSTSSASLCWAGRARWLGWVMASLGYPPAYAGQEEW